jgi:hypothetical protein
MQLNLIDQQTYRDNIAPKVQALKEQMDKRLTIWSRLPFEKRKAWVTSGKDPIMTLAWQMYKYLRDNFFGEVDA